MNQINKIIVYSLLLMTSLYSNTDTAELKMKREFKRDELTVKQRIIEAIENKGIYDCEEYFYFDNHVYYLLGLSEATNDPEKKKLYTSVALMFKRAKEECMTRKNKELTIEISLDKGSDNLLKELQEPSLAAKLKKPQEDPTNK